MTSRLGVYNGALRHLGERRLVDLTEERAARRELDDCYDDNLLACLLKGYWNHAMRAVILTAADDLEPSFGFGCIFVKPADWLRTMVISENERFDPPLLQYTDETEYVHADSAELYLRYVSSELGRNEALWPRGFADFVEVALALRVMPVIKPGDTRDMERKVRRSLANARAIDAMDDPPGFPPMGTWAASRNGNSWLRGSRWSGKFSD